MAGSVNKVILIGNLGRDPEVQRFPSGGQAVKFSIATSERWPDKATGEKKEKTEWHNIVIYNENLGRIAEQYLRKGSKVYLEGQLQTREYTDKDGVQRRITEVVLQRFRGELTLLDGRGGGAEFEEAGDCGQRSPRPARGGSPARPAASGGGKYSSDLDDEIPF
jgi:single-strand DNA-binding protein